MKQKTIFSVALTGLLVVFFAGVLLYTAQKESHLTRLPDATSATLPDAQRAALVRMHSPVLGNPNAPVVIVEFIDPACETCREFYPLVKKLMAEHPERIRLVLRYAPLHEGSDKVVAVLEAARSQGKFWPALEALLAAQSGWVIHHKAQVALVWKHLEGLGLNFEQMQFDLTAPAIAQVIAQDIADGRTLNVTKTPEFFVNGRPLPVFGYEELKKLVDLALKETQQR